MARITHSRIIRSKTEAPKRSARSRQRGTSDGGASMHPTARPPGGRLGASYAAGPALRLGGPVQARSTGEEINESEQQEAAPAAVQQKCAACEAEDAAEDTPPVQAKCETCEAADEEGGTEPVQLWDCSEYDEPTCVQTKEAFDEGSGQEKCGGCESEEAVQQGDGSGRSPGTIHRHARSGLRGANQPLPHGDRIQVAFGRHDISHVRTNVGGGAASANRRMGALAFTSGSRIGFRGHPSLRLAAHEAAHVVQQREGVSLQGHVGRPGDRWERHADRVADAVVRGHSAEPLLDQVAGGGARGSENGAGGSVQRQITSGASRLFEPPPVTVETAAETTGGGAGPEGGGEPAAGDGETSVETQPEQEGSAMEAAQEGDTEAPPEDIPSEVGSGGGAPSAAAGAEPVAGGGGSPAPATSTQPGAAGPGAVGTPSGTPAPGEEAAASGGAGVTTESANAGQEAQGGGISASCYRAGSEPPGEDTPEPTADERGSDPREQPQVEFEPWPDAVDDCPAEATVVEGAEQMPAGSGEGLAAAAGGPGGGGAAGAGAETPAAAGAVGEPASAEVQTMSRAAATQGEANSADTSMEGPIASARAEREIAVNDYLGSTAGLDEVLTRSQSLESNVTFPDARGPQQIEPRQAVISQTRAFMAGAAAQIAAAATFAQDRVPDRLGGLAEGIKANIQGAMETEKATISARVAQARAQARAGAAAARAHVNAEYASSAAQIEAVTSAAITALDARHAAAVALVDEKETTGLDDVNSRFAAGRTQHEEKGPLYGRRAIRKGQEHAHEYERCKGDYSDDGFWDGCLTVRRARAQQDAACKTAAGYKDVFLRTANKKGYDLIQLRKQYRCAVIAGARQVNRTLDDTHDPTVSGLESGRTRAMSAIELVRDQNLSSIDAALSATLQSLATQEHSQRQAINDTGYLKQLAVEQLAHAGAAGLARGIAAAMDSLEKTLETLRQQFAQGDIPDPATLAQALATAEAALGGGMGSLLAKMEEGAQQAEGQLDGLGAAALEALFMLTSKNDELCSQAESGFSQQMDRLMAGASDTFAQLTGNQVEQAQTAMTEGIASMDAAVTGFDTSLATIGGRVDEAIATSLGELDGDLGNKLGELDGQIATEAWKAAEKEQPAWKSVVAIVLVILVIIAAAVISIVTLGAGASLFAIILVGALVGAVSAGLIQIINNWASGEAWHTGVVQAMIIGAVGGAIGGGLGFAGGALAAGAAAGGARVVTQLAITVGSDLLAEGLTQTFGYVAFGQEFNWQGFVMAGAMSGVSFRAHPGGARGAGARADVPSTAAAGGRRAAATQIAGGAALGLGIEAATAAISGQEFDLTKAASAAASGAVGARMARRQPGAPPAQPTSRLGRAAQRVRGFDPGGVGARLETGLQGFGARAVGGGPETGAPGGARPKTADQAGRPVPEGPTGTKLAGEPAAAPRAGLEEGVAPGKVSGEGQAETVTRRSTHDDAVEIEPGVVARRDLPDEHAVSVLKDGRVVVCSSECGEIRLRYAGELSDPLNEAHLRELNRIEGIADPEVKLDAAVRLRNNLDVLRGSGISRPPSGADGAAIARAAGLPDAPDGYQWVRTPDGVEIRPVDPDRPRIRFDDETGGFLPTREPGEFGTALRQQVELDAADIIAAATSQRQLRRLAATSRAGVAELDIVSPRFENIRANVSDFNGVRPDGDVFTITDIDAYMAQVRDLYIGSGQRLHPETEQLILHHIRNASSFDTHAGLPGLHAEIRAVNHAFHELTARGYDVSNFDLGRLQVATHKVAPGIGQGGEFAACRNCGSILPSLINILTGRRF